MTAPKTPYEQGRLAAEVGWTTFNNHYYQFLEKEQRRDWRSGFLSRRAELARAGANAPVPLTFQQVREKWGAILRSYPNGGKLYGQPENEIRKFLSDLSWLDLTAELVTAKREIAAMEKAARRTQKQHIGNYWHPDGNGGVVNDDCLCVICVTLRALDAARKDVTHG